MNSFAIQRICAWSGLVGVVIFFMGMLIAGFIPPPSPSLSESEVVTLYQQHANTIRIGMIIVFSSGLFISPLVGVISAQIRRMSGVSPALTYAQISAGALGVVFFYISPILCLATAYRPDRLPDITYFMNDLCWCMLIFPFAPAFIQNVIIGVAILGDQGRPPVFPRWAAYANFWMALGYLPAALIPLVKEGPFTWSGLLAFWLPAVLFGLWFMIMLYVVLKAINAEEGEQALIVSPRFISIASLGPTGQRTH